MSLHHISLADLSARMDLVTCKLCGFTAESSVNHDCVVVALNEAHAAIKRVRELCSRDGYTTWDRDKFNMKKRDVREAWEAAHGHDFRMKCYPEFGCQLLVDPEEIRDALDGESE
jgi:hypothetical protein